MSPLFTAWNYKLMGSSKVVGSFLASVLIFVMSKMLSDGIAIYGFGLAAPWYCTYADTECVDSASPHAWLIYALCLIPPGALLKHLSEDTAEKMKEKGQEPLRFLEHVPQIMNYVVGWGAGNAMMAWTNQTLVPAGFPVPLIAVVATFVGTIFLFIIKPFVKQIECGNSDIVNWIEDLLEDVFAMIARSLTVIIMSLWYAAFAGWTYYGVDSHAMEKVSLLALLSLMSFGSTVSVAFEELENSMKAPYMSTKIDEESGKHSVVFLEKDAPLLINVALEFSNMVQSVLAWLAGCAGSGFISYSFDSIGADPSLEVLLTNVGLTLALTLLCVVWLILSGESTGLDDGEGADREEVEKFFITNAMGFFIFGGALTVGKQIVVPTGMYVEGLLESSGLAGDHSDIGERVTVLLMVPAFAVIAIKSALGLTDFFSARADAAKGKLAAAADGQNKDLIMSSYQMWSMGKFSGKFAQTNAEDIVAADFIVDARNSLKNTDIFKEYKIGAKAMVDFCAALTKMDFSDTAPEVVSSDGEHGAVTVRFSYSALVKETGKTIVDAVDTHDWTVKNGRIASVKITLGNTAAVDAAFSKTKKMPPPAPMPAPMPASTEVAPPTLPKPAPKPAEVAE
jgi:hypothetical protein